MRTLRRSIVFAVIFAIVFLCLVRFGLFQSKDTAPEIRRIQKSMLLEAKKASATIQHTPAQPSQSLETILIPNPEHVDFSPEDEQLLTIYMTHLHNFIERIPVEELNKKILFKTNYPLPFQTRIQDELRAVLQNKQAGAEKSVDFQLFTGEAVDENHLVVEIEVEHFDDSSFSLRGKAFHSTFEQQFNYRVTPTAYGTWNYQIDNKAK